jgi:hypothetical protein
MNKGLLMTHRNTITANILDNALLQLERDDIDSILLADGKVHSVLITDDSEVCLSLYCLDCRAMAYAVQSVQGNWIPEETRVGTECMEFSG